MMRRLALLIPLLCLLCAAAPARADWLQQTLQFQQDLGDKLPLRNAPWLGTHNSFNTRTETPTLSGLDANQQLSMAAQLDLGMRSLEIDIHTFPSLFSLGTPAPVVCHARSQAELNAGCTTERLLDARLQEIRAWLDAHPHEVILLYLEDHLDGVAGSDAAAEQLNDVLGDKLYKPPAGGGRCVPMPLGTSRAKIRRSGAQVLAISGCGEGSAWPALVFDDAERARNEIGPEGFNAYPGCDPEDTRDTDFYRNHLVRVFEDSTVLTAVTGGPPAKLDVAATRAAVRCGVDMLGLDQLVADDPRLAAAAWSWAPDEPSGPGCVYQRVEDARWITAPCKGKGRFACQTRLGNWAVGTIERYRRSKRGCAGAHFAVPRTGLDGQLLRDAMRVAKVTRVWVRYKVR